MCQIRAGGVCMRVEGTVLNVLKVGGTEKSRGETNIFKQGGQAGSRGWNPLRIMNYV